MQCCSNSDCHRWTTRGDPREHLGSHSTSAFARQSWECLDAVGYFASVVWPCSVQYLSFTSATIIVVGDLCLVRPFCGVRPVQSYLLWGQCWSNGVWRPFLGPHFLYSPCCWRKRSPACCLWSSSLTCPRRACNGLLCQSRSLRHRYLVEAIWASCPWRRLSSQHREVSASNSSWNFAFLHDACPFYSLAVDFCSLSVPSPMSSDQYSLASLASLSSQ